MTAHSGIRSLPLVDLSRLDGSPEARARFLGELCDTLHHCGFFYLTGHGVSSALIADVLAAARRFFALPLEEKLRIEMVNSPHFRGYNRPGAEYTRGAPDWREQVDVDTEAAAVTLAPGDAPWKRLIGPNQWPDAVPELRPLLLAYQAEATRVGMRVLKAVAGALGQAETIFDRLFAPQPSQLLKIIHYPSRDIVQSKQGVGPHKDSGLVTLLLQDTVPGLRVRTEAGDWLEAAPVPGTFIINTGELLELATNGFIRANVHEVLSPPAGVDRFSIAFFLGGHYEAEMPVFDLPPALGVGRRGLTPDPLNPLLRDVGQNHLKSRLRSHPDVARRYHADLLPPEDMATTATASPA